MSRLPYLDGKPLIIPPLVIRFSLILSNPTTEEQKLRAQVEAGWVVRPLRNGAPVPSGVDSSDSKVETPVLTPTAAAMFISARAGISVSRRIGLTHARTPRLGHRNPFLLSTIVAAGA